MFSRQRLSDLAVILLDRITPLRSPCRRVLAFHDTPDRAQLSEKLLFLKQSYEVVPLSKLLTTPLRERQVIALTFDDGYSSWHEIAAPVLNELNLSATFFVCSGFLDLSGASCERFVREHLGRRTAGLRALSRRALREIADHPAFEIGAHTANHLDFALRDAGKTFIPEVVGDKTALEDLIGKPISSFAYPFGTRARVTRTAQDTVRQAGFQHAYSLIPGPITEVTNPFARPRLGLALSSSAEVWTASISGAYEIYYRFRSRLPSLTSSLY